LLKKSLSFENKIIRDHVRILEDLGSLYSGRADLYKKDINRLLSANTSGSKAEIDDLLKLSNECFEEVEFLKRKIVHTDNTEELFRIFNKAHNKKQLEILYQEKIYATILNGDADLKKCINEEIATLLSNMEDGEKEEKEETEKNISQGKDSVKIVTVIVHDTIKVNQIPEDNVLYKVQIAAAKRPISINELKRIYEGTQPIQWEIENKWYKYSVGYFFYYREAKDFKLKSGVSDAFIIAYKNEKKIPISQLINHPSYLK